MSGAAPQAADLGGLWPHQREAVQAAAAHLARGERCQVIMACGTGKTRAGAETSRRLAPAGKVLVVVPTQELLAQTARVYAEHLGAGAGMIGAVCAEPGATADAGEVRGQMAHLHAGVSTDPADVARWLRASGRATIFTTYASLPAVAAAHDMPRVPGWDLAVVDEAHRAAGRAGRVWSLINEDAAIPAGRRLYMTATPRVMPGDRDDIVSMDDEKVFGPEVFRVSFAQAIGQGLLADYRVAVAVVTSAEVAKLAAGETVVSPTGAAVPARMLAAQLALLKAAAQHDLRRVITYHQRVAGARRFAQTLPHAAALLPPGEGPELVHAGAVDGSMRLAERREILRPLLAPGGQTVVVSNSRVLSEGVDVPELDAVMFADPRDSGTDVVQAVGRALRLGTRKSKTATIIIPVLLNQAEAPHEALESSEFATVWRVVRALRAHDERMADWLDQQRIEQALHDSQDHGPEQQEPGWLSVAGVAAGASFAAALQVRIVTAGSSPWLEGYARAATWHAEHGHLVISCKHVASDGYPLGRWIHEQRGFRKKGRLSTDRIARLDDLAMVWDMREAAWLEGLSRLRAWHAARGHLAIPQGYQDADGFRLGSWVSDLRRRRASLSPEKITALDALGMAWNLADYRWQTDLAAARDYHTTHGHLNVPYGYILPGGLRFDQWILSLRRKYDRGTLSDVQVAAVAALGITLSADRGWTRGLQAARVYHAEHGHINVPKGHLRVLGINLGNWIVTKRVQYRDGTLDPARAAVLEQLGITWRLSDRPWDEALAALREFRQAHGHVDVLRRYVTPSGYRLGSWLSRQRSLRNAGQLAPERAAALEQLGVRWDLRTPPELTFSHARPDDHI